MKLFHYTTGHKLAAICNAGVLLPSAVPARCADERGVLWFSANQTWEPTATKPIRAASGALVRDREMLRKAVGLYRFVWQADCRDPSTLPPTWALYQWPTIGSLAGISNAERAAMSRVGIACGASPSDWFGRMDPLEIADLGLELMTSPGTWVVSNMREAVAEFNARNVRVLSVAVA